MADVELEGLDLGYAALFLGYAYAEAVMARVERRGYLGVRFAQGFLIQHLVGGEPTVGEIAEAQGVSPQAVSQALDELVALGYVERRVDPTDARRRRVALTPLGWEMVEATREARRSVEVALVRRLGRHRTDEAAATLRDALGALGGVEAVRTRRVRPPR